MPSTFLPQWAHVSKLFVILYSSSGNVLVYPALSLNNAVNYPFDNKGVQLFYIPTETYVPIDVLGSRSAAYQIDSLFEVLPWHCEHIDSLFVGGADAEIFVDLTAMLSKIFHEEVDRSIAIPLIVLAHLTINQLAPEFIISLSPSACWHEKKVPVPDNGYLYGMFIVGVLGNHPPQERYPIVEDMYLKVKIFGALVKLVRKLNTSFGSPGPNDLGYYSP